MNLIHKEKISNYSDLILNKKANRLFEYYFIFEFVYLLLFVSGYNPLYNQFSQIMFAIFLILLFVLSYKVRKICELENNIPIFKSKAVMTLVLLIPVILLLLAMPLSFLFVKYETKDGISQTHVNVLIFLPIVFVLMLVTHLFLYKSVNIHLNQSAKEYAKNHKDIQKEEIHAVSNPKPKNQKLDFSKLTEGEIEKRKKNIEILNLSVLLTVSLSVSGCRPFSSLTTTVLFVFAMSLVFSVLVSSISFAMSEKKIPIFKNKKELFLFFLFFVSKILTGCLISIIFGVTALLPSYSSDFFIDFIQMNLVSFILSETFGLYVYHHVLKNFPIIKKCQSE